MPNTETRSVKETYWYTGTQITDVGLAWAKASPDRVHLYRDVPNRSAFEVGNVPELDDLPKKILLPVNKGSNHWTAFAIEVSQEPDDKVKVSISYTDSLNGSMDFKEHDEAIRLEKARLEGVFREKYGPDKLIMSSSVYPHTWMQPDGSSCGPYSLANAARCLDRKGYEANPGRRRIREDQLDMMTNVTAIKGCSTGNAIDEILLDWIIDRTVAANSLSITTPEHVKAICDHYALKHNRVASEIVQIFHNEYNSPGTISPSFYPRIVNTRVRELIGEYGIKEVSFSSKKTENNVKKPSTPSKFQDDYSDLSLEALILKIASNEAASKAAALQAAELQAAALQAAELQAAALQAAELQAAALQAAELQAAALKAAELQAAALQAAELQAAALKAAELQAAALKAAELQAASLKAAALQAASLKAAALQAAASRAAVLIGKENISKKIDNIRKLLPEGIGDEEPLILMEKITIFMYQANSEEAEKLIKNALVGRAKEGNLKPCLELVSDIIGMRRFNELKFIYLASAYKSLADAMKKIKSLDDLDTPKSVLDTQKSVLAAHVHILQGAIDRNNASLIKQVGYAIQDFCSAALEFVTGRLWKSDIKRIQVIRTKLINDKGNVSTEQLKNEQSAIETILSAKSTLETELGEDLTSGSTARPSYP